MISVVFPAYNEEGNIEELHRRLTAVLRSLNQPFEIIAVDDGSRDRAREKLLALSPITVVIFARNAGQNAAVDAGLKTATGDIVVTIDADLQNPPEEIPRMIAKLHEGYDVVLGWRKDRNDSFARRVFSRLANTLVARLSGLPLHDFSCALKAYRREFIAGTDLLGETFIFLPLFAHARRARITEVAVAHAERKSGVSKHHISEMVHVFFDLVGVVFLTRYFKKPMRFFGAFAMLAGFLGVAATSVGLLGHFAGFFGGTAVLLWVIAGLFGLLAVLLSFFLGLITETLLRISARTGEHPPYMIQEVIKK